eukprot:TRINITY_DN3866_c0_g1_i2.p3 TRINITY_DN3866_c0_g1~~TRINITY_DN3866_c0_g1_i2.p3  ORF type:complete len:119 (+),score=12.82 TRINITY_DN3866_c0_g1_i2:336-692(+)
MAPRAPLDRDCCGAECAHAEHAEGAVACVLLARLVERHVGPGRVWAGVTPANVCSLFLAALLVARKLLRDFPPRHLLVKTSARGCVSKEELARLEVRHVSWARHRSRRADHFALRPLL